jgi:hypothetical protein
MICLPCRTRRHSDCIALGKDKTWCDCQHTEPATKGEKKAA